MSILFDTGSADLWVPSQDSPRYYTAFNYSASVTFKDLKQEWWVGYGSGKVTGSLGEDTVTIGNLTVEKQTLALANNSYALFASSLFDSW